MISPVGDAYRVRKCKEVRKYKIMWDYKHENRCYELFPVRLPGNRTKFLELKTRRLLPRARTVSCDGRQAVLYIRDKDNAYWRLKKGKTSLQRSNSSTDS